MAFESFYGGQQGTPFSIAKTFANKKALIDDIMKRNHSSIGFGEFVFVSYGAPVIDATQEDTFKKNQDIDYDSFGKVYNGTLWQKIFVDYETSKSFDTGIEAILSEGSFGVGYKLIASLTGNTPRLTLWTDEIEIIDPETNEIIKEIITNQTTDADKSPKVELILSENKIDEPVLKFTLPKSQVIGLGDVNVKPADTLPSVELNSENINNPLLNFNLPKSAKFIFGSQLGKRWEQSEYLIYSKNVKPNAEDSQIDKERKARERANLLTLDKDDFYITDNNGSIYKVTRAEKDTSIDAAEEDKIFTVVYLACLARPDPEPITSPGHSYWYDSDTDTWHSHEVDVSSYYTDNVNKNGFKLKFTVPKIPKFRIGDITTIGVDEDASASISYVRIGNNSDELALNFNIPRGSRFFAGTEIDDNHLTEDIEGSKLGDYYINTNSIDGDANRGHIYLKIAQTDEEDLEKTLWENKGTIQGPAGPSLKVIENPNLLIESTGADDDLIVLNIIQNKLIEEYPDGFATDNIVLAKYTDSSRNQHVYFCTYSGTKWTISEISGQLLGLLAPGYEPTPSETRGYTANYINNELVSEEPEYPDHQTYNATKIDNDKQSILNLIDGISEELDNTKIDLDQAIVESLTWGIFLSYVPEDSEFSLHHNTIENHGLIAIQYYKGGQNLGIVVEDIYVNDILMNRENWEDISNHYPSSIAAYGLKKSYLNNLEVGNYRIKFVFSNGGFIEKEFDVVNNPETPLQVLDHNNIYEIGKDNNTVKYLYRDIILSIIETPDDADSIISEAWSDKGWNESPCGNTSILGSMINWFEIKTTSLNFNNYLNLQDSLIDAESATTNFINLVGEPLYNEELNTYYYDSDITIDLDNDEISEEYTAVQLSNMITALKNTENQIKQDIEDIEDLSGFNQDLVYDIKLVNQGIELTNDNKHYIKNIQTTSNWRFPVYLDYKSSAGSFGIVIGEGAYYALPDKIIRDNIELQKNVDYIIDNSDNTGMNSQMRIIIHNNQFKNVQDGDKIIFHIICKNNYDYEFEVNVYDKEKMGQPFFNIGDRFTIIDTLNTETEYDRGTKATEEMVSYAGQQTWVRGIEICSNDSDQRYFGYRLIIDRGKNIWTELMSELGTPVIPI